MDKGKSKRTRPNPSIRLTVSLPRQLHDQLEQKAQENDASMAWVIRRAVASYLQGGDGAPSSNTGR